MSRLIVYAGPNGSGKSTIRDIAADPVEHVLDPDRVARALAPTNPAAVSVEAGKEVLRRFHWAMTRRQSISLETTLTGHTVLARMRQAKAAGYDVSLLYVALVEASRNIARVAARVANGGHFIPAEVIRHRVTASQDNLAAALAIADHGKVHDNSGLTPTLLLTVERGRIVFEATESPDWLRVRLPRIRETLRTDAR